ncbi:MAG: SRPBCC family protein [Flavobacteriaceae bacterium]
MRLTILILVILSNTVLNAQNQVPTNKHFWYTMETTTSPDEIWSIWTNVKQWKDWDTGLKDASIDGEFKLDTKGAIISLEGRKSKFKVVEYEEGKTYTYKTKLPLGSLYVKRYLKIDNGITTFTHEVWFQGLTAGVFSKALGEKFRKILPNVLENIKQIAENQ